MITTALLIVMTFASNTCIVYVPSNTKIDFNKYKAVDVTIYEVDGLDDKLADRLFPVMSYREGLEMQCMR